MDKGQLGKKDKVHIKPILVSYDQDHIDLVCCYFFVTRDVLTSNTSSNFLMVPYTVYISIYEIMKHSILTLNSICKL